MPIGQTRSHFLVIRPIGSVSLHHVTRYRTTARRSGRRIRLRPAPHGARAASYSLKVTLPHHVNWLIRTATGSRCTFPSDHGILVTVDLRPNSRHQSVRLFIEPMR
jgi:hypothetical protein